MSLSWRMDIRISPGGSLAGKKKAQLSFSGVKGGQLTIPAIVLHVLWFIWRRAMCLQVYMHVSRSLLRDAVLWLEVRSAAKVTEWPVLAGLRFATSVKPSASAGSPPALWCGVLPDCCTLLLCCCRLKSSNRLLLRSRNAASRSVEDIMPLTNHSRILDFFSLRGNSYVCNIWNVNCCVCNLKRVYFLNPTTTHRQHSRDWSDHRVHPPTSSLLRGQLPGHREVINTVRLKLYTNRLKIIFNFNRLISVSLFPHTCFPKNIKCIK